jgi:hypothetical protein
MKIQHLLKAFILACLMVSISSCEVVEAIFKTGVGIGVFVTVSILVVVLIIIGVIRRKKG